MVKPAPLALVGRVDVPKRALEHRFHAEALANAMLMEKQRAEAIDKGGVIGTENTREVELYGWASNVDSHVDNSGYVYIVPLNAACTVVAWRDGYVDNVVSITAKPGDVLRLDDFALHWTEEPDGQCTTAAFLGSYPEPCDEVAMGKLRAAIAKLAAGDYYGSPRVRPGFRALRSDECLAADDKHEDLHPMLLTDARKQKRYVELCGKCNRPAIRADEKWPYFSEMSRCRKHLGEQRKTQPFFKVSQPA